MAKVTVDTEAEDVADQLEALTKQIREQHNLKKQEPEKKLLSKIKEIEEFKKLKNLYESVSIGKNVSLTTKVKVNIEVLGSDIYNIQNEEYLDVNSIEIMGQEELYEGDFFEHKEVQKVVNKINKDIKAIRKLVTTIAKKFDVSEELVWKAF